MLAQMPEPGNPQDVPAQEVHPHRQCRTCGARVYWMQERYTGRWAEIDMRFKGGDVLINITRGTYEHLNERERRTYGGWMHALHSRVCSGIKQTGMR